MFYSFLDPIFTWYAILYNTGLLDNTFKISLEYTYWASQQNRINTAKIRDLPGEYQKQSICDQFITKNMKKVYDDTFGVQYTIIVGHSAPIAKTLQPPLRLRATILPIKENLFIHIIYDGIYEIKIYLTFLIFYYLIQKTMKYISARKDKLTKV